MKAFAQLYSELDSTTKTTGKIAALRRYLESVPPEDAAWAIHFLIGRRPKRLIESRKIWQWAIEESGLPEWLFAECTDAVGDFAETIALLLPPPSTTNRNRPLHWWVEQRLLPLREWPDDVRRESLLDAWRSMEPGERFVWNKLITGEFRVGVSQNLLTRSLAEVSGVPQAVIAHRLMGSWDPSPQFVSELLSAETSDADASKPYPFCLAYPLEGTPESLGAISNWMLEWKWDGIRSQLIRRNWRTYLWSRGEELITERFPEVEALGSLVGEGVVIDGEVLPWAGGMPLPFTALQRRIGRKVLGPKILREVPAALIAYDLLELDGRDVREEPLEWRRSQLAGIVQRAGSPQHLILSPELIAADWEDAARQREAARERGVEGFMLKRRGSPYRAGRRRGDWWKWKIQPFSVDAVLIYAQPGSGKRASLFTDYTFGVWNEGHLVPFAKAYSGLTDAEIREVDAFVRNNTLEKFGPVRTVKPELVFELAFEAIQESARHKSGIAVRFPRIARWRTDKKPDQADSLDTIRSLLRKTQ